jgi:hypothetical protein
MKLAEALILRADIQKRMEQVRNRLYNNVLTQEGELPSEDPNVLLKEFLSLQNELTTIIKAINRTNNNTPFNDSMMLSEVLVERDGLLAKRAILSTAAERASDKQDRYSRTEIKYVSVIDIKKFQKDADRLAKEYRELDTKIQGFNWNVDLI